MRTLYSLSVVLGSTLLLSALAPQARADGTDHFTYTDHTSSKNTLANSLDFATDTKTDAWHQETAHVIWGTLTSSDLQSKDADNIAKQIDWEHPWGHGHHGDLGAGKQHDAGAKAVAAAEPSSLFLLLSGCVAAALGLALKKAAT